MRKPVSTAPQNWQQRLFWVLMAFTLGVTMVSLVGEAFITTLIWYIRFTDLIDLILNLALYLFSLIAFHELMLQAGAPRRLRISFLVVAFLFLYGHAMHVSTNAVNTFGTEIRKYTDLHPDMYALLYFFDETLSHLIIDISQFLIFAGLLVLEVFYLAPKSTRRSHGGAIFAGILFGVWQAIVYLEGQKLYLAPFVVIGLGGLWIWLWWRSQLPIGDWLKNGPLTAFMAGMVPSILLGMAIYLITFGNFIEPSKQNLGAASPIPLLVFLGIVLIAALLVRFLPRKQK